MSEQFKKAFKSVEFPLRQSLFWIRNGQPDSTWSWLSRQYVGRHNQMYQKLIEYNVNTVLFAVYCPTGEFPINLFKNNAGPNDILNGAELDWDEVRRWQGLLSIGNAGINLIPTVFFGERTNISQNKAFLNLFLPAITTFLLPYSTAIILACEANRGMDIHAMADGVNLMKGAMTFSGKKIPVGVHLQSNVFPAMMPSEADFYAMEWSHHPITQAEGVSIEDCIKEARRVMACSPVPVLFVEDDAYCESPRARGLARELAKLDGCYCLPGPV